MAVFDWSVTDAAVIVAVPAATPVTRPLLLTVALVASDVDHRAPAFVAPVTVAVSCCVPPTTRLAVAGLTVTVTLAVVKLAATLLASDIVTEHEPSPVQSPLHPPNLPLVAVCVRATDAPLEKLALHVPLVTLAVIVHEIPDGLEVTVPFPSPMPVIVNTGLKAAVTARSWDIVTWQLPVPVQSPVQPAKAPLAAVAVSVTCVPLAKVALQPVAAAVPAVIVHEIPEGLDVTVPLPVPPPVMRSVSG